jgi:hypothetical protein
MKLQSSAVENARNKTKQQTKNKISENRLHEFTSDDHYYEACQEAQVRGQLFWITQSRRQQIAETANSQQKKKKINKTKQNKLNCFQWNCTDSKITVSFHKGSTQPSVAPDSGHHSSDNAK